MAYIGLPVTCHVCKNTYAPINNNGCPHCVQIEKEAKRKAHFAALDQLTLEERIRKIEEWIYSYKPPKSTGDTFY